MRAILHSPAIVAVMLSATMLAGWPERVPVTVAEVDIFERYFGDVLDRLFGPIDDPDTSENSLLYLTSDGNQKP